MEGEAGGSGSSKTTSKPRPNRRRFIYTSVAAGVAMIAGKSAEARHRAQPRFRGHLLTSSPFMTLQAAAQQFNNGNFAGKGGVNSYLHQNVLCFKADLPERAYYGYNCVAPILQAAYYVQGAPARANFNPGSSPSSVTGNGTLSSPYVIIGWGSWNDHDKPQQDIVYYEFQLVGNYLYLCWISPPTFPGIPYPFPQSPYNIVCS